MMSTGGIAPMPSPPKKNMQRPASKHLSVNLTFELSVLSL